MEHKLPTGRLTPKSNDVLAKRQYTGGFGQPDGFGSILVVDIRRSGDACLTLHYRSDPSGGPPKMWSVMLDNEQRKNLGKFLSNESFDPTHIEEVKSD